MALFAAAMGTISGPDTIIDIWDVVSPWSSGEDRAWGAAGLIVPISGRTMRTFASGGGANVSRVLLRTPRNLQKFFGKHGSDFGLSGNWNPSKAADASRAIHQHINGSTVQTIQGTYRGRPATHYLDPNSGLNVVSDSAGNFVTGYRLGAQQLQDLVQTGYLF